MGGQRQDRTSRILYVQTSTYHKPRDTAAEIGSTARSSPGLTPVRHGRTHPFPLHDGARPRGPSVGEFAGLAESSTCAGESARIVTPIRTETGPLSFLAQP